MRLGGRVGTREPNVAVLTSTHVLVGVLLPFQSFSEDENIAECWLISVGCFFCCTALSFFMPLDTRVSLLFVDVSVAECWCDTE